MTGMIEIAYPSYASGEPRPMKAAVIHAIAAELRSQLFRGSARRIEVAELARRAGRIKLNGREVRVIWDLAHKVHDNKGTPVLGICEHDPQEPRAIMISLDAALADETELFRSTAARSLPCRRSHRLERVAGRRVHGCVPGARLSAVQVIHSVCIGRQSSLAVERQKQGTGPGDLGRRHVG